MHSSATRKHPFIRCVFILLLAFALGLFASGSTSCEEVDDKEPVPSELIRLDLPDAMMAPAIDNSNALFKADSTVYLVNIETESVRKFDIPTDPEMTEGFTGGFRAAVPLADGFLYVSAYYPDDVDIGVMAYKTFANYCYAESSRIERVLDSEGRSAYLGGEINWVKKIRPDYYLVNGYQSNVYGFVPSAAQMNAVGTTHNSCFLKQGLVVRDTDTDTVGIAVASSDKYSDVKPIALNVDYKPSDLLPLHDRFATYAKPGKFTDVEEARFDFFEFGKGRIGTQTFPDISSKSVISQEICLPVVRKGEKDVVHHYSREKGKFVQYYTEAAVSQRTAFYDRTARAAYVLSRCKEGEHKGAVLRKLPYSDGEWGKPEVVFELDTPNIVMGHSAFPLFSLSDRRRLTKMMTTGCDLLLKSHPMTKVAKKACGILRKVNAKSE